MVSNPQPSPFKNPPALAMEVAASSESSESAPPHSFSTCPEFHGVPKFSQKKLTNRLEVDVQGVGHSHPAGCVVCVLFSKYM